MEPNKLEDDFREKLNSRTIQPSEMAWDRLDAMLSVTEKKKPKRNFKWMYMAAVFVGMLFVGTLLMEQQKQDQDLIIKENIKTVEEQNRQVAPEIDETNPVVIEEEVTEAVTNQKSITTITPKTNTKPIHQVTTVTAGIKERKQDTPEVQIIEVTPPKEIKKTSNTTDVEGLLASVEKGATTKGSVKKQNVKVDASSLLNTVEGEITADYRDGVFQAINRNFKTVKSAVANRNNE